MIQNRLCSSCTRKDVKESGGADICPSNLLALPKDFGLLSLVIVLDKSLVRAYQARNTQPQVIRNLSLMLIAVARLQVRGLEWNAFGPNFLASGGADSEITIWDLAQPLKPTSYPANKARPVLNYMQR